MKKLKKAKFLPRTGSAEATGQLVETHDISEVFKDAPLPER